jgi:conjugal transfer pilin signal peptidase TrbI
MPAVAEIVPEARTAPWWRGAMAKRWALCLGLAFFVTSLPGLREWGRAHAIVLNTSDSLPNYAFFVKVGVMPRKGEFVLFEPPMSKVVSVHFGKQPPAFGKLVLGAEGDVVSHVGRSVLINGRVITTMKPLTRKGLPLIEGPVGRIPKGCYYAGSYHEDGLDSRYAQIGFVCGDRVMGTGVPIL